MKTHIEAGDIYQANLTFAAEVPDAGHPLALYAALRGRAPAPAMARIVFTGAHWMLSLSPELFFTLERRPRHHPADEGHRAAATPIPRRSAPIPSSAPRI